MIEIFVKLIFFFIIISSNGIILGKLIFKNQFDILNIFEYSIIGLIFTGFLSLILNFFFPLNNFIIISNFIFSICFIYIKRKNLKFIYNIRPTIFIILVFALTILNIYASGFSDDLNHYHGGSIINSDNGPYIIGSNLFHHHYGYSSIWLILHSYLNFNETFLQDIHILNGLIFFATISYFTHELHKVKKNFDKSSLILISSAFLFFFLLKYTRLKEFGIDRPGILIFCFLIYFFFKYQNFLNVEKYKIKFLFILSFIVLFLFSIKLIFIISFTIPLIYFFHSKSFNFFFTKSFFLLLILFSLVILKNFLISGCFIYPIAITCISEVAWNSKIIAQDLIVGAELLYKSFNLYEGKLNANDYIKHLNWFFTWLPKNIEELSNYLITSVAVIFLILISFKLEKNSNSQKNIIFFTISILLILYLLLFNKSPVFRFHHMLFILLIIFIFLLGNYNFLPRHNFLIYVLIVLFSFNIGKNSLRIIDAKFVNNPSKLIKDIGWYRVPTAKSIGSFQYYNGWIDAYPVGNMDLSNYKYRKFYWFHVIYD